MSKSFVITSHTEGAHPFEQTTILNGLVKALRHYFPDSFIIVASQSSVDTGTQQIADFVIVDKVTANVPHGAGELALVKQAHKVLKEQGKTDYYKLCYDFVIDDTNVNVFDQWSNLGKEFVSCYWRTTGLGIGTWIWFSTTQMHEILFDFDQLDKHLEWKLMESASNKGMLDRCFLYDDQNAMFNGDWFDRCDLVHAGGSVLKHNYGTVSVALDLTDESEFYTPAVIQSIANQTKAPSHLVLVDRRSIKKDLRTIAVYQDLFNLISSRGISWNLIYYMDQQQLMKHLADLGHTWCMLVDEKRFLDTDAVKQFYQRIILNRDIGSIEDKQGNFFYRNMVVDLQGLNTDIRQFVVDKMLETCYNNISC